MSAAMDPKSSLWLSLMVASSLSMVAHGGSFYQDFDITWGDGRARVLDHGQLLTLSLDRFLGSGFQSKEEYLFGKVDMQIKLVPGNSAGTVAACYVSTPLCDCYLIYRRCLVMFHQTGACFVCAQLQSGGPARDEIDFEFLGNLSGEPYTVHTNIYTQGKGEREQQFHLWFDPTGDFHSYSILWNRHHVVSVPSFAVDGIPIRDFKNMARAGVAFPRRQPMRLFCSLWSADEWATRGGLIKTDWSRAPFVASYRGFRVSPCPTPPGCGAGAAWLGRALDPASRRRLRWVRGRHMIYDYCADARRFPQDRPPECGRATPGN
ncbi:hypothetical protein Taro_034405 [Colocasia esculenta]|uniref:Xyloglucan endotransglucosylase/hydrolase n=1 Tax=Colocasia esculenta TaxID=4460 RepID=A0A843W0Q7_COLES|nr:hypothetical protein [Colocasia esculenta]